MKSKEELLAEEHSRSEGDNGNAYLSFLAGHAAGRKSLEDTQDALRCMQQIIKANGSMNYEEFKTNLEACNLSEDDL